MKTNEIAELYSEYILPTYLQAPVCLVKGKGSYVWDAEGKEYLDFFPGWAVSGLGHCHPAVVNAIKTQATRIIHIPNNFYNAKQARLAKTISEHSFPARVFFCNSGAEATEGAIKFARRFGAEEGRYEIITMKKSFHGRTMGAMVATAQEKVQKGYDPLLQGFRYANFNDLESVKSQVTEKTAAVFLEPVQGEGGIQVATPEFMKGVREICDQRNLLLIVDEVQTGMGRSGKMFAYQHFDIEPDIMTLAKSLGGGVPIGALVVNKKIREDIFTPGTHGSTYGGNPLVAAASLAVFRAIKSERLIENVCVVGEYFSEKLKLMKERFECIEGVRGIGLMCALDLNRDGAKIVEIAREKGLLINCTQGNIIRILPAINVTKKLVDRAAKLLNETFEEAENRAGVSA